MSNESKENAVSEFVAGNRVQLTETGECGTVEKVVGFKDGNTFLRVRLDDGRLTARKTGEWRRENK